MEDSNAVLFVNDQGERGILAQQDIAKGDVVVQVRPTLLLI